MWLHGRALASAYFPVIQEPLDKADVSASKSSLNPQIRCQQHIDGLLSCKVSKLTLIGKNSLFAEMIVSVFYSVTRVVQE